MLDPTCPDITGRVLEALCRRGFTLADETVGRAVEYLLKSQERNGSWYGRWGVDYIYGTFLALRGLRAAHAPATDAMRRASKWLISVQNADGGLGRELRQLSRRHVRLRAEYSVANRLGAARHPGERREPRRGAPARPRFPVENPARGRHLGRGTGDRHGVPERLLPALHTLYRQYFPHLALAHARRLRWVCLARPIRRAGWLTPQRRTDRLETVPRVPCASAPAPAPVPLQKSPAFARKATRVAFSPRAGL